MSQTTVYLLLSEDIQSELANNKLDIDNILREDGIDATVTYGGLPSQDETGARSKDLVTIIVASSVLVPAIAFSISQVLNAIYNRPYIVEYEELEEIRDSDGNVMLDYYGKPLFKSVKRFELIDPSRRTSTEYEAQLDPNKGLTIKFTTKQEPEE